MGNIWASNESREILTYLTDGLDSRFAGTEGEELAADLVANKFREYDLEDVKTKEFDFQGWQRGRTEFVMKFGSGSSFPAIALPFCPPENIEGELIDLGDGLEEDFEREIEDKIVLVTSRTPSYRKRWLHRGEKYSRAVEGGAAGFVFINHYPGNLSPTGSLRSNQIGEIPGIGVSKETGEKIKRILKKEGNMEAEISVEAGTDKATSYNVVGEINPDAEEVILIGGHIDGHDISQGAEDNGAGITTVLDTARALAPFAKKLNKTLRFVGFGAEELGLIGSKKFVEAGNASDVDLVLNFDGPGRARDLKFITNEFHQLAEWIRDFFEGKDSPVTVEDRINPHSDHWQFITQGIPGCQVAPDTEEKGRGWGHTSADTLDKIDFRDIKANTSVLARLIISLQTKELATQRKEPKEIKQLCEEQNREHEIDWLDSKTQEEAQ